MIDYTVYVGPFLECEYAVGEVTCYFKACPNQECSLHRLRSGVQFCPSCGTRIESLPEIKRQSIVDRFELIDEIEEALFPISLEYIELPLVHIWVPNVTRNAPREFSFTPQFDCQVTPIVDGQKDIEEDWFKSTFSEEIQLLEKHYEKCNVRWGILSYMQ